MTKFVRIINTLIITLGCAFFLLACDDLLDFQDLNKSEDETGIFRLVIESEASSRTILPPTTGLGTGANYYKLAFTSTTGKAPVNENRDNTNLSTLPIYLAAGTWNLTVTAYTDSGRTKQVATETFSGDDAITITAGAVASRTLTLKPIITGTGTGKFDWSGIDFSSVSTTVTNAKMTITPTGAGTATTVDLLIDTSGLTENLPVGYYRVVLNLSNGTGSATMLEVLHIYENMTSGPFSYTFTDDHFTATAPSTSYTVTFNSNGGTPTPSPINVTPPATTVGSLPTAPTRTGWTFVEWNTAANRSGSAFIASTTVNGDITVYAIWKATVTFNGNGGTTPSPIDVITPDTNVGSLPTPPTRTGWTFVEWNTAANRSGSAFIASTTVTGDIPVYAIWKATVTFNSNGGTPTPSPIDVITPATNVGSLPTPPTHADGYTFVEWNTALDGSGTAFTASTTVTGDIPVYAQWAGTPAFTIEFEDFDEIAPTLLSGPTLSLASSADEYLTLTNPSQYATISWNIGSTELGTSGTLTLNSSNPAYNAVGKYIITVIVTKTGVPGMYSATVEITVGS